MIVLGAEIGGGVYAYLEKDNLIGEVEGLAGKFFNESYGEDGEGPQTTAWNLAMETVSYKFIF